MKNLIALGMIIAVLTGFLGGCKKKTNFDEALEIAEAYYAAVEDRNVELAHGYMCDRSYVLQAPTGETVQFGARPDLETYKMLFQRIPDISVISIEPRPDLSNQEAELLVFEVTVHPHTGGLTPQSSTVYMGRNSKGEWSIMLPLPQAVRQTVPVTDSVPAAPESDAPEVIPSG